MWHLETAFHLRIRFVFSTLQCFFVGQHGDCNIKIKLNFQVFSILRYFVTSRVVILNLLYGCT